MAVSNDNDDAAAPKAESQVGNMVEPNEKAGEAPETSPAAISPEETIAKLEAEVARLKDQLLRALAETENTRRRARREVEDTAKYAVANLAKDFLAAPDNLRRALDNIPADGRQSDELLDKLAAGVELVEREMHAILERHGIKRIDPLGQPFDHNFHQALFEVPTVDQPAGTVVQVLAPGYVIHDRLLRPAMVGVAKTPTEDPKSGPASNAGTRVDTPA